MQRYREFQLLERDIQILIYLYALVLVKLKTVLIMGLLQES